jgi:RNA polymerase sigma factor (sigma-70 family)
VSQAGVSAGYVTVSEAMASASYVDTFEVAAELDVVPTYEVISVSNQSQLTIDSAPPAGQVTQVQAASTTSEPGGETNPVRSPTGRELNTSGQALRADTASLAPSSPVALSQTFLPPAPSAQAAPVVSVVPVTFAPASTGTTTLELALTSFATATPPNTSLPTRVALAEVPDHVLLRQFTEQGEQPAFTELVRRHEPAVMAVTTRVLGDPHKAQDAAQSTFMILSRRASTLDGRAPLSGWLYKVAYHLALRYQTAEMRRRRVERDAANRRTTLTESEIVKQIEKEELLWVLSEELQRLPEKYRAPLALCYFQGRTHAEAAREIGLPRGSIAKRIGQGLERLRERLLDRGFLM